MKSHARLAFVLAFLGVGLAALAAAPPAQINYQGVLRNSSDSPLTGTYDMVFSFWDASSAGNEILDDSHLASGTGAVTVSNGLFNVALGGGAVTDGPAPGTYTALDQVFRDYSAVWLEVKVGGETLSPRTQMIASAYALNASNLGGQPASSFVDTSGSLQSKVGGLVVGNGSPVASAQLASGSYGINATGQTGSYFGTTGSANTWSYLANNGYGVQGKGSNGGGYFQSDPQGTAVTLAGPSIAVSAQSTGATAFLSTSSGYGVYATGGTAIYGSGSSFGLYGSGGTGVYGTGSVGVYGNGTSQGVQGFGPTGVTGNGGSYGVYGSGSTYAVYGNGGTYGVYGTGTSNGVYGSSGNVGVEGNGPTGVYGAGGTSGVYGASTTGFGVQAYGAYPGGSGGYFYDYYASGSAFVGDGDTGVAGNGRFAGAHFTQGSASGANAYLAYSSTGIAAYAANPGENPSYFNSTYNGNWASVGQNTSKVTGNGSMGFVQNHPGDPTREIVYNAPEGDEIAVYTRGSARLVAGEAHVALGETFRWVTNPDVGLTATVTPRGEVIPLAVVSVTPTELVVRGPAGSATAFDYLVYGLRIGFEERPVVRPKTHESPIPGKVQDEDLFAAHPELRAFTALARHESMREAVSSSAALDLSRSKALEAAIGVGGNPGVAVEQAPARERVTVAEPSSAPKPDAGADVSTPQRGLPSRPPTPTLVSGASAPAPAVTGAVTTTSSAAPTWPVSEPVEAGDVLVIDDANPGALRLGASAADAAVAGVAAGPSVEVDGRIEVVLVETQHGVIRVDAASGSIRPGDLLVTSPLPGHAMRAPAGAPAAAIIGKALEGLESGQGTIRVLLGAR